MTAPSSKHRYYVASLFALNFIRKPWLGDHIKGLEGITFAQLLLYIYVAQLHGRVLTKREAMQALGVDSLSTVTRYATIARDHGFLDIETSLEDRRVHYLVPKAKVIAAIEQDLDHLLTETVWASSALQSSDLPPGGLTRRIRQIGEPAQLQFPIFDPGDRRGKAHLEHARLLPKNHQAHANLASAHVAHGDYKSALKSICNAVELAPDNLSHTCMRAFIYSLLDEHEKADADVRYILKHQPTNPRALLIRAQSYARKRQWKQALAAINAAIDAHGPSKIDPEIYEQRAHIHDMLGNSKLRDADLTLVAALERDWHTH